MSKVFDLRNKLQAISRISKMTESMQVVAAAQLRNIQHQQRAVSHYKKHYDRLAGRFNLKVIPQAEKSKSKILIYALFSERGFCGGFNENLLRFLKKAVAQQAQEPKEVKVHILGARGCILSREAGFNWVASRSQIGRQPTLLLAEQRAQEAYKLYLAGEAEKIFILYNDFESMLVQTPQLLSFLPFDLSQDGARSEYLIVEPSNQKVKERLINNYLKIVFYDALMQNHLGEVAARLLSMRGATENSKKMINELGIKLNKARQSTITCELSEIVSSFEILNQGEF